MHVSATSFPAKNPAGAQRKTGSAARPNRLLIGEPARLRSAPVMLMAALLLTGCFSVLPPLSDAPSSPGTPDPDATASLFVTIQAAELLSKPVGFRAPETARVTLTKLRGGSSARPTIRQETDFQGSSVTVGFDRIETGPWRIDAEALAGDVLMYQGGTEVYVSSDEIVSATVALEMLPGNLEVFIVLEGECLQVGEENACLSEVADRGRIMLAPDSEGDTWHRDFDWTQGEDKGTATAPRLEPGEYEFQLVFYSGDRRDGNIVYESHWLPFRIEPGHTTSIYWHPEVGTLDVNIQLISLPPAPSALSAAWTEEGVVLSWTADALPPLAGYNVWFKNDRKKPFSKADTLPSTAAPSWVHTGMSDDQCLGSAVQGLFYVVTAINEQGTESLRSNEVDACALLE